MKDNPPPGKNNSPDTKNLWWGTSAFRKRVTLNAMSFHDFATTMEKTTTRMKQTTATYHALTKAEKGKAKDTRYWTPCSFTHPERNLTNADKVQLIAIDIDDGAFAHTVTPEYLHDLTAFGILPFSWILHSTTGHTVENPRYRIIIDASSHFDAIHYPSAVLTISKLLGLALDKVNSESRVVCQAMYVPKLPSDAAYIFASYTDGIPFAFDDIDQTLAATATTTATATDTTTDLVSADGDGLEYVQTPADEGDDVIQDALKHISSSCKRPQWVKICGAMKHQYQHDLERGFEIFHNWSSGAKNYVDEADVRKQWEYEKANTTDREPATIRTVFHLAKQGGWAGKKTVAPDPTSELAAMTADQILKVKCPELRKAKLGKEGRKKMLTAIKKRLAQLGEHFTLAELRELTKPTVNKSQYAWLNDWIFVLADTPYYLHTRGTHPQKKVKNFNDAYAHLCPISDDGTTVSPHFAANRIIQIPTVTEVVYRPDLYDPKQKRIILDKEHVYNTYVPAAIQPDTDPQRMEDARRLLTQAVHNTTDNPQERQIVWDFFAHMIQKPAVRINWALLMQGVQGSGKTLFYTLLKKLNGKDNTTQLDGAAFLGSWNEYVGQQTAIFIDEIRVPNKSKYAVLDKFKSMVANSDVARQQRFTDTKTVPNFASTVLATNHMDAIPIGNTDRRIAVVFSHLTTDELLTPALKSFFSEFYPRLDELAGAYLHILRSHTISDTFDPFGHAPMTKSKAQMMAVSKCFVTEAIEELIEDDYHPLITADALSFRTVCDCLSAQYPDESTAFGRPAIRKALQDLNFLPYIYHGKKYRFYHAATHTQHPIWVNRRYRQCPVKRLQTGFDGTDYDL